MDARIAAKKARDFEKADVLQAELRSLSVEVDDEKRLWYVRYHDGGRAASSFNVRGW
jgi:cysteinyl-tRNA synthetase